MTNIYRRLKYQELCHWAFSAEEPIYTCTYLDDRYIAINTHEWVLAVCGKCVVGVCTVSKCIYAQVMWIWTCICACVCTSVCCTCYMVSVSVGPMYKHVWYMFAQMFRSTKACRGSSMCALPQSGAWLSLTELCVRSTHLYGHLKLLTGVSLEALDPQEKTFISTHCLISHYFFFFF